MPPTTPPTTRNPGRLPTGAAVAAGVLVLIPLVALALVPTYTKQTPRLWGFPFFYWWQFLWIPLATIMTGTAYLIITRARRNGGQR
jgi:Protein of unknown function (DUF3311)